MLNAGTNLAAGGETGAGKQIAGLTAMDAADQRFLVVQAAHEEHFPRGRASMALRLCPVPSCRRRLWPTIPCWW